MNRLNRPLGDLSIYTEMKSTSNNGYFTYFPALLLYQRVLSVPDECVGRMLCESNFVSLGVAHVTVFEIDPNHWNTLNHVVSDKLKIVNLDYLATNEWYVRFKTNDHYEYSEKCNTNGFEFDGGKVTLVFEIISEYHTHSSTSDFNNNYMGTKLQQNYLKTVVVDDEPMYSCLRRRKRIFGKLNKIANSFQDTVSIYWKLLVRSLTGKHCLLNDLALNAIQFVQVKR